MRELTGVWTCWKLSQCHDGNMNMLQWGCKRKSGESNPGRRWGEQKGFLKETKRVFCHERKGMHPKEGYDIYRDLYGS